MYGTTSTVLNMTCHSLVLIIQFVLVEFDRKILLAENTIDARTISSIVPVDCDISYSFISRDSESCFF